MYNHNENILNQDGICLGIGWGGFLLAVIFLKIWATSLLLMLSLSAFLCVDRVSNIAGKPSFIASIISAVIYWPLILAKKIADKFDKHDALLLRLRNDIYRQQLVKVSDVKAQLQFARSIAKRLDEHRELVESLVDEGTFLASRDYHTGHLAVQDDFLMRLYYMVHGVWPYGEGWIQHQFGTVRPRPEILGECRLPEYKDKE